MAGYGFNPITGKIDRIGTGGGGGGGGVTSLNPDQGGAITADIIAVIGATNGSSKMIQTDNVSGNLVIEDRAFWTPYVVDSATTVGKKGTYTTIQAAINAVIADGAGGPGKIAVILIRPKSGDYIENLNIGTANISFIASTLTNQAASNVGVRIFGNVVMSGVSALYFQNISIISSTGQSITISEKTCSFKDCYIESLTQAATTNLYMKSCRVQAATFISGSAQVLESCYLGTISTASTNLTLYNCREASIVLSGGAIVLDYGGMSYNSVSGISSGVSSFYGTSFSSPNAINATATINISGILGESSVNTSLIGSNPTPQQTPQLQGNILHARRVAANATISRFDHYIGVTDTSSARTLTLPSTGSATTIAYKNQHFIIKDESLAAGTNNITIVTNGGLIDGLSSFVINTNGGAIEIVFNGTNYFVK